MEQQKPVPSLPENYARAIIALSRRYSSTSAFPGNNYADLAEWILLDRALLSSDNTNQGETSPFASKSKQAHDLIVTYTAGERKWIVQSYSQEHDARFRDSPAIAGASGEIVFARGFLSPSWVAALGSRYNVDPEFFRRHMDYLSANTPRHAYGSPSLISSSHNIYRLCVSTILHRDDFGGQDARSERMKHATQLASYKAQQLGSTKASCGDSVVREYSSVCPSLSLIEQWISICLMKSGRGWVLFVWMDQGRPLETSPPGPWTLAQHVQSKATALPVLQHHYKMAFRNTKNRLDTEANESAEIQQSTSVVPLQYDSLLNLVDLARSALNDPVSASIPLFAHANFSEVQALNLLETLIQEQMDKVAEGAVSSDGLSNLQYFATVLSRHAQNLANTSHAFNALTERASRISIVPAAKSDKLMPGSRASSPSGLGAGLRRHSSEAESTSRLTGENDNGSFTTKGVLEDIQQLHHRCLDLSKRCREGMRLAVNTAAIEESRKAIEQSGRVKKLTLLATLFIPLSFTSGLFGMNVNVFGQSDVGWWWFFVLCIPITLAAYLLYLWDYEAYKKAIARWGTGIGHYVERQGVRKPQSHVA